MESIKSRSDKKSKEIKKKCNCFVPMLAEPRKDHLKSGVDKKYILQEKFDGTRGIMYIKNGVVTGLINRTCDSDYAKKFPEIVNEAKYIKTKNCILDGEITFFKKSGHPFFLTANAKPETKKSFEIRYMVFDIVSLNNKSVKHLPLMERLKILEQIIPSNLSHIKVIKTFKDTNKFQKMYKQIVKREGEGVILKHKESKYVTGSREHWVKIKKEKDADCIVVGITNGTGRRKWTFGALVLAQYHKGKLTYVGNVGVGLSDETLADFYKVITEMKEAKNPFDGRMGFVKKFVPPVIVVEVKYLERTNTGILRLPVFSRIRTDKNPKDCTF
jgi:bifunctional non-homologous end joining protein LigD